MLSLRVALLLMALTITIPIGCMSIQNELFKRSLVPPKLHQSWFFADGVCASFFSYEGAFAIGLAEDTIKDIKTQGLSFFSDISKPIKGKEKFYYTGEWRETPIPAKFNKEGDISSLRCGSEYSLMWPSGIEKSLLLPGSYYADADGFFQIYVIPSLRLVVVGGARG